MYRGKVTYSVNFDSHDSFTFGDCLDVIGMNTYDPIAKYDDYPSQGQIRDAWWWIVAKARTLQVRFGKPVMITEVGYPSVAHAHVGPWDFRTEKPLDLQLQKLLVQGAFDVEIVDECPSTNSVLLERARSGAARRGCPTTR